eukprot:1143226-Pelagomonas_calceolata.AAC.8
MQIQQCVIDAQQPGQLASRPSGTLCSLTSCRRRCNRGSTQDLATCFASADAMEDQLRILPHALKDATEADSEDATEDATKDAAQGPATCFERRN